MFQNMKASIKAKPQRFKRKPETLLAIFSLISNCVMVLETDFYLLPVSKKKKKIDES